MININKHENCGNESKRKRNYEILLVLIILCFTFINVSANYDQYVIKWVVPSAPASNITVSVSPTSVPANGFNFATITLQAVSGSNPISNNSWVNLSVNSSTAKFSTSGTNMTFVKLNNTGGYSLLLNNTVVETVRINATNTTYGWVNNTQTVDFTSYPRIIIDEIMYNPSVAQGGDNYSEWIELYNPTEQAVNLSGWTLCDVDLLAGYINHSDIKLYKNETMKIPAKGYAIVTDGGSGTWVYDNFSVDSAAIALHVDAGVLCGELDNNGDTITLKNDSVVINSVTYTDTAAEGKTLERNENETDWYECKKEGGTPGKINSISEVAPVPPNITSWNPVEKTISNIEGESRTFSISINQTVNVSWEINGTEVFNQSGVNFSEYVSTGVIAGTWNVTANASNENGTDMQTWDWFVSEMPGGGGGGARSMDSDGDGYTDIQEMLAGTDENDPCDPNPECPACLAIRPPAPTPSPTPTPTETPTLAPTFTPSAPATPAQTPSSTTLPPTTNEQKRILILVIGLMAVSIVGIIIYVALKLRKK